MLFCANNLLNSQLLYPIWSCGASVALYANPRNKCKLKEDAAQTKTKSYFQASATNIAFLPCYLDRMMPLTTYISNCIEIDKEISCHPGLLKHYEKKLLHPHVFNSLCGHSPVRTFKSRSYNPTNPEDPMTIETPVQQQSSKGENKDEITNMLKLLKKNLEKQEADLDSKNKQGLLRNFSFHLLALSVLFAIGLYFWKSYSRFGKFGKTTEDSGTVSNITFDDVCGVDEAKAELRDIVEYLQDPQRFTDIGAKLPKGILLVGPPGTGKTLLAKAVAGEAGVSFFYASGSEFDEVFVGLGALRVRQLFEKARKRSPAIIFLDEIDACGGKRTANTMQPYARQTINQLLQEMDGFTANDTVVVLAATNDAKVLDKALVRPGRFDTQVQVLLPDIQGRKDILELYISKLSTVSDSINLDRIASLTIGSTGADLSNLVNQAALQSVKLNKRYVDQDDLEFALDKIRMGPELKSRIRSEKELKRTAYHEAGHALVAHFTPAAHDIYKATIMQRGPALGHVSFMFSKEDEVSMAKSKLLAMIDVAMGGQVAEEIIFGNDKITTGGSSDIQNATEAAYKLVCGGMSEKMGPMAYDLERLSPDTKRAVEDEVRIMLDKAYGKAKKLLTCRSFEHNLLTEGLVRYETLDMNDIKLLLDSKDIDAIGVKREKEHRQKMIKKLESSNNDMDLGISAPVIDYIPTHDAPKL